MAGQRGAVAIRSPAAPRQPPLRGSGRELGFVPEARRHDLLDDLLRGAAGQELGAQAERPVPLAGEGPLGPTVGCLPVVEVAVALQPVAGAPDLLGREAALGQLRLELPPEVRPAGEELDRLGEAGLRRQV
jgi:hypothetical protein